MRRINHAAAHILSAGSYIIIKSNHFGAVSKMREKFLAHFFLRGKKKKKRRKKKRKEIIDILPTFRFLDVHPNDTSSWNSRGHIGLIFCYVFFLDWKLS